jgi:hypothetical protein
LKFKAGPKQKHKTPSEKITKAKRARGVTQVVEHLPSKLEALSSNLDHTHKHKFQS